jgi:hypothetical protein
MHGYVCNKPEHHQEPAEDGSGEEEFPDSSEFIGSDA